MELVDSTSPVFPLSDTENQTESLLHIRADSICKGIFSQRVIPLSRNCGMLFRKAHRPPASRSAPKPLMLVKPRRGSCQFNGLCVAKTRSTDGGHSAISGVASHGDFLPVVGILKTANSEPNQDHYVITGIPGTNRPGTSHRCTGRSHNSP